MGGIALRNCTHGRLSIRDYKGLISGVMVVIGTLAGCFRLQGTFTALAGLLLRDIQWVGQVWGQHWKVFCFTENGASQQGKTWWLHQWTISRWPPTAAVSVPGGHLHRLMYSNIWVAFFVSVITRWRMRSSFSVQLTWFGLVLRLCSTIGKSSLLHRHSHSSVLPHVQNVVLRPWKTSSPSPPSTSELLFYCFANHGMWAVTTRTSTDVKARSFAGKAW